MTKKMIRFCRQCFLCDGWECWARCGRCDSLRMEREDQSTMFLRRFLHHFTCNRVWAIPTQRRLSLQWLCMG